MPTFRHGKNTKVLYGMYALDPFLRESNIQRQADVAETTAFGSTVKTYVMGVIGATASFSGMFSGAVDDIDPVLSAAFGVEAPTALTVANEGVDIGRRLSSGLTHQTTYSVQGSASDMVSVSCEFQATGGLIGGYSLHDLTPVAAPGNATPINSTGVLDIGNVPTTNGGYGVLHSLSTNTLGVANTVVKIQHSVDNSVWNDLVTFAALPFSAGGEISDVQAVARGVTINRWLRAVVTFGAASTGSIAFHVNFVRYPA